ncbi:MAG: ferrous iron transport protein A, partial [Bacilli bacterium]|nr:ferrous iron transport protein A [Bacilli bacterium]
KKQAKVSHLGLVKNAYIQKKHSSMMGNPVAYQIYGTVFALRNEDAKHIEVEL